jgi:hypothetical protein
VVDVTKTQATKAKQLAQRRQTQIWVLLSPREATALLAGLVPSSVHRQIQRLVDSKGLRP